MRTALIVIDVQNEYFDGRLPIGYPDRDASLSDIELAMDAASSNGIPVIVVRHTGEPGEGSFEEGSNGWELRAEIAARPRDVLIDKHMPGSFTDTPLGAWLDERSIDHVTICGYMTNVCCDTTARQALHRGMQATILHDAMGVPPMRGVDDELIDAESLHRAALAPLRLIGVEMMTSADWIDRVRDEPPSP